MIHHEIDSRLRDEDREFLQELDAPEDEGARTVGPRVREGEADATIGEEFEAVLRQRGTKEIMAEPFERPAILGADGAATVEIEIGGAGVSGGRGLGDPARRARRR